MSPQFGFELFNIDLFLLSYDTLVVKVRLRFGCERKDKLEFVSVKSCLVD